MAIQQTFEFLAESAMAAEGNPPCHLSHLREKSDAVAAGRESFTVVTTRPEASVYGSEVKTDSSSHPERELTCTKDSATPLDQLRAQVGCINTAHPGESATNDLEVMTTGSDAIDGMLPRAGLRSDAITEWVAQADGCGAAALSMIAAATRLQQTAGPLVVVSPPDFFYPPAAVALGIPANRIIWVRPTRHADTVWAIDQALRSEATAVVWAPVAARLDDRDARRFQLAAEIGSTPGLLIRPQTVRGRPTFADIRFHVSTRKGKALDAPTQTRAMRVTLDRCRGGQIGRSVMVRINDEAKIERQHDEAAPLHLASQLANPQRTGKQHKRHRA